MHQCLRLALLVFAWLAIFSGAAYAQAAIAGVVRDTSGAVLPGVTVEASSPALIEKIRSVVSDGSGQYRIENLRPGPYTVTFTIPGFSTVRREGIQLTGTFVATVNAELRVGALEETVTVTGESPTVDLQSTVRERVIDREAIDTIPFGRIERDLAILVPGVMSSRVDVGGSSTVTSGSASIHGSRESDQRMSQGGLSIGAPSSGASTTIESNMLAYQEVTVETAAVDAEHATGGLRINLIPREGANTFNGVFLMNFANEAMQSDNYTQDLRDRGLRTPNRIKTVFDINPGVGGPIMKDRLWFFTATRYSESSQYPAGILFNRNANNPNAWTYVPDESRRPSIDSSWKDWTSRLTWQATPRNKFGLGVIMQASCYCLESVSATRAPEAGINRKFPGLANFQPDWTNTLTSRILLEAGLVRRGGGPRRYPATTNPLIVAVTEQSLGNLTYRGAPGLIDRTDITTLFYRAAVSYITGTHALKIGFTGGSMTAATERRDGTQPFTFRLNNGVPNQITLYATPFDDALKMDAITGVYAQDKWTIDRLTLSYGMRYDYFKNSFPTIHLVTGPLVPTRDITLPFTDGLSLHDITPKLGAAYDILGSGKTAVKVTLNKYLEGFGSSSPELFGLQMAPVNGLVNSTTRSWNDANRDFVPDCVLTNPLANGECGPMANRNFGTVLRGATYDPEAIHGWDKRGFNWEFSAGVQHELVPRVSVDVSYFRRWYGNFFVTDDRAVGPSDFDPFSINAPVDPRLPGGGGYVISGLYDLKPAKFGVPADRFVTLARNYGKQTEHWNGFDATMNARPGAGVLLQGGVSTGRTATDKCDVVTRLDNPSPLYCQTQTTFRSDVKFLGSYTIPRIDVLVSGTLQSVAGPQILADYIATNAVVAPSLGRNLAGGESNVTVNLVEPGTMYGERMNRIDLRVGKILRFGRTRATASVDLFNALNSNAVLTQNNAYAAWQRPTGILLARFVKIGLQMNF